MTDSQIQVAIESKLHGAVAGHEAGHFVTAHEFNLDPVGFIADWRNGVVVSNNTGNPIIGAAIGWSGIVAEHLLNCKIAYRPRPATPLTAENFDYWLSEISEDSFSRDDWDLINRAPWRIGLESAFTVLNNRRGDLIRTASFLENFFAKNLAGSNPLAVEAVNAFSIGLDAYASMGKRKFLKLHPGCQMIYEAISASRFIGKRLERRDKIDRVMSMAYSRNELSREKARLALVSAAEHMKKGNYE